MAKAFRLSVNIGMVDALIKMLRTDRCPRCMQEFGFHSWVYVRQDNKEVIECSVLDKE